MNIIPNEAHDQLALQLLHCPMKKKHADICHAVLTAYGERQFIDARYLKIIRHLAKRMR